MLALLLLSALDALPVAPVPADHPVLVPDERFAPLNERDGIRIRVADPGDGANVVRSEIDVDGTPEEAAALLSDVERWPEWVKRVRVCFRVAGEPPAFHLFVNAPWPFSDRDYGIVPFVERRADGAIVVWWESAAERLGPERPGYIRVRRIRGGILFTPTERGTHLVYSDVAELGGRLPRWAIRESYKRGPIGVLGGMRQRLAERRETQRLSGR